MADAGWIKIYRKIFSDETLSGDRFSKREAWIWLISMAAFKDRTKMVRGIEVAEARGQIAVSTVELAKTWLWDRGTVVRFLDALEKRQQIKQQKSNVTTLISICNYEKYQQVPQQMPQQMQQQMPQQTQTTLIISSIKEDKEYKETSPNGEVEKGDGTSTDLSLFPSENPEKEKNCAEKEKLPADEAMRMWNELCPSYPRVKLMSESRKNKLRVRLGEMGKGGADPMETLRTVFTKMEASSFLKGGNRRGWRANLDWVLENTNNWVKIFEGNYDNENYGAGRGGSSYSDRRGYDVNSHKPEDYEKQF